MIVGSKQYISTKKKKDSHMCEAFFHFLPPSQNVLYLRVKKVVEPYQQDLPVLAEDSR